MRWERAAIFLLVVVVVASRMLHVNLVWVEEAYGLAAGAEVLRGKVLYQDIWFDKPPLYALYYSSFGAQAGLALRLAGSLYVLACCALAWRFAGKAWGRAEGLWAAGLLAFALVFWVPSAVMAVAPDVLMIGPHLAAVYLAWRGKAFSCGIAAGIATLCNSKGLLLLVPCVAFLPSRAGWVLAGWVLPQALSLAVLPAAEYWRQVWWWGYRYSSDSFVASPVVEGLRRTANWAGFHATLVLAAAVCLWRERRLPWVVWLVVCAAGVVGGMRFFPRYYFMLLPVGAVLGSRGLVLMRSKWRIAVLALLVIPAVRFGGGYWRAAAGVPWSDTAMMEDSRRAGTWLKVHASAGDTVFVWGYRPEIYVFSGLPAGSRFLDSQPITGVLADRHLSDHRATFPALAAVNRARLVTEQPTFVVDGLGPLNPALALSEYEDLRSWLRDYEAVADTQMTRVYRRRVKQ